jgi:hypothetical protein
VRTCVCGVCVCGVCVWCVCGVCVCVCICLAGIGFALKAFHLLGRHTTSLITTSPYHFALVIFQTGAHVFVQSNLDLDHPVYASYIAAMTSAYHNTWLTG